MSRKIPLSLLETSDGAGRIVAVRNAVEAAGRFFAIVTQLSFSFSPPKR
ncbi:MAG TPA: hypothetical protein VMV89_12415 [Candidatus Paceibacterota bacterium]|nr:hypothetical protein [Candidatus Paceibacterota bacterium]